jgi:hypothetical protein
MVTMKNALRSSKTSVLTRGTQCNILEDGIRKHCFMSGINIFMIAVQVSMAICAVDDHQFRRMMKTSSMCTTLYNVDNERVFRRYHWRWEY